MSELLVEKQQGVPEGYKLTEVGVIPEDWDAHEFGSLINYRKGYAFKSRDYQSSGLRIIRVSDTSYSDIKDDNPVYISEESASKYSDWSLRNEDLIFSTVGSKPPMYDSLVGKVIKVSKKYHGSLLNQNAVRIRAKSNVKGIHSLLLNHFRTTRYIDFIEVIYRGNANQASITLESLFGFQIPLPRATREQTAIATALSDVDELLASLEELIAKKQAIKTATMQQLLSGRTRLPQFALREDGWPKGYKPSELGEIPEDWEVKSYEEIFTYLSTSTNSRADLSSIGDYGYVHYGDIHTKWNNKLDLNQVELPQVSKELVSSAFIEDGDVIMADASEDYEGVGKSVEVSNIGDRKAVAGLHTFLLRDREKKLSDGFRGYLHTIPIVKASLDKMATGLKVYGISKRNLALILIPIPSKQEQTAIATILSDMDAEIEALEKQLSKTQQIKQGMMQQLLTGKIRLVKPN